MILSSFRQLNALIEKAPPGWEPTVKKMKGKSGIDNPYALAWSMSVSGAEPHYTAGKGGKPKLKAKFKGKQAVSAPSQTQLLRGKKSAGESVFKWRVSGAIKEAQSDVQEGRVFEVVLISEGLGNRRQMNYYGPEAIESAVSAFEGKPAFLNHPSESQEIDRPERTVEEKCGYFKNLKVVNQPNGLTACAGEFHADLSEAGKTASNKLLTALHYQGEFPDGEYVGFSICANGRSKKQMVKLANGEEVEANYVSEIMEAMSCDLVTEPARGGKVVALLESMGRKEGGMNALVKVLSEAASLLSEARSTEVKKVSAAKMESAEKMLSGLVAKAKEAEDEGRGEGEDEDETALARREGEDERSYQGRMKSMQAKIGKILGMDKPGASGEGEGGDGAGGDAGAPAAGAGGADGNELHAKGKHAISAITGKSAGSDDGDGEDEDEDEDETESKRDAVKYLLKEAGIPETANGLKALMGLPYSRAKSEIIRFKSMREAWRQDMASVMPEKTGAAGAARDNTAVFSDVIG